MLVDFSSLSAPSAASALPSPASSFSDKEEIHKDADSSASSLPDSPGLSVISPGVLLSAGPASPFGEAPLVLRTEPREKVFASSLDEWLSRSIGSLDEGKDIHFYSFGNFNLVRLVMHLLK